MTLKTREYWWPITLSDAEEQQVECLKQSLKLAPPQLLDLSGVRDLSDCLGRAMSEHVENIIEADSLPHLCHVWNGWGDFTVKGERITTRLRRFVDYGPTDSKLHVKQCHPEGDFHAGQSFAYCVMAGVEPATAITADGHTLSQLLENSNRLLTDSADELGHYLFALAHLHKSPGAATFVFGGASINLSKLVDLAISAHYAGGFDVCRKFHLTEGICAASALIPELSAHRSEAQYFLDGQLEMLFLVLWIRRAACEYNSQGSIPEPDSLLRQMRNSLVLGPYLENEVYYAGHLIELACFAYSFGFEVPQELKAAMAELINSLNQELIRSVSRLDFVECFLHLGHYRRAVTMFAELDGMESPNRHLTPARLRRYTAKPQRHKGTGIPSLYRDDALARAPSAYEDANTLQPRMRPRFRETVEAYEATATSDLLPYGIAHHFRRTIPTDWPRSIHYELLDHGEAIGCEIHTEDPNNVDVRFALLDLASVLNSSLVPHQVIWDPSWYDGGGRLAILCESELQPETIAAVFAELIRISIGPLNTVVLSSR